MKTSKTVGAKKYGFTILKLTILEFLESVEGVVWEFFYFGKDMTGAQHGDILAVLKRYSSVFLMKGDQLEFRPLVEQRISTEDASTIKEKLPQFGYWEKGKW